jgi:hypothetical protein
VTPQLRDTPELRSFAVAKFKYLFFGLLSVNSFEDSKMVENIIYKYYFLQK